MGYYTDAVNFLKYHKDGIFTPEKIETLNSMIDKNPDAINFMNFGIFQDEIFKFGPEFCEYMSKFPALSCQLLIIKDHNPQLLEAMFSKVKDYDNIKDNLQEIEIMITYGAKNTFELENQEINIDDFIECAYRNSNDNELINVPYGEKYKERLAQKLQEEYSKVKTPKDKLDVYLNKFYSISLKKAEQLLTDFATDLDNLQNVPEETKQYFKKLQEVIKIVDEKQIDDLFKQSNQIYSITKLQEMKSQVSKECAKDFSVEFKKTGEDLEGSTGDNVSEIEYNGQKIKQIKLTGKFNMLLHSTDTAFLSDKEKPENFKADWYKGKDNKKHVISTTYVNQDFLGTAPVGPNGVRYAFATLESNDIRLMGVTDLNTYVTNFAYESKKKQYMSAKSLAYNSRRVYSEFGIERDGTKPDYVVLNDDDLPEVVENTYKAASDFGIPIVYIDKKEIEKNQIQNIERLLGEFKTTKDTGVLKELLSTYETNMAGWLLNRSETPEKDESHTSDINNERFRADFEEVQSKIEDEIKQYLSTEKGKDESCEVIQIVLQEMDLYDECEKTKPISKTKISFNARELLESANRVLDENGQSKLKVNLENIPTARQWTSKMNNFMKNALQGERAVTLEDVGTVEKEMKAREEFGIGLGELNGKYI